MQREYPTIPFERYADDVICHCASEAQALELHHALDKRFAECRLRLHPQKTKIVYCKDANRPEDYLERSFDLAHFALGMHGIIYPGYAPLPVGATAAEILNFRRSCISNAN
ncbi:hypothetical protein AA700_1679 [Acidiphilium acidophilum DSM 700]|nr:hypothetical protein AA700_1679 [Acidiphilium acidophilum DSM 700]